ncbi:MAG TPA: ABC transporter ATP-binding protein, partial [Anaerolineae bacterium]|nr:ABC transporter ATP-binding protein [Anaerolineae bacterium]
MPGVVMVRGLSYRFGGRASQALSDVSLEVGRGELVAVAGPSGCGKSTLALAIGGYLFHQYDGEASGSVYVAGLDARRAPIYDLAEVVGLVQQNPEAQFCTLNVDDEIAFGLENRCLPGDEIRQRMAWALGVVGAGHLAGRALATLSGGEKQKVAIAAVLAARPQVLILDEPTSNLDPTATAEVFRTIARLREVAGITVIVIEHKLGYLRPFNPRLVAMEAGRIVSDGRVARADFFTTKDTKRDDPLCVLRGPASPSLSECVSGGPRTVEPVVRVEGLYAGHTGSLALRGLSLEVAPGEVVAVMGDNGAGKTTLLLSLLGLLKPQQGKVEVLGCDTRRTPVSQLAREVAFVFQNPDHQLFAESVWLEATFAPRNLGALSATTEARAEALLARSGLGERTADHPCRLSYGEKRRLNLASVLAMAPRLILLDELLIGQDPANAAYLMGLLCERAAAGAAVIMAAHDPEIVRAYATRLVFLDGGLLLVDAPPAEAFAQLAALGRTAYLPLQPDSRACWRSRSLARRGRRGRLGGRRGRRNRRRDAANGHKALGYAGLQTRPRAGALQMDRPPSCQARGSLTPGPSPLRGRGEMCLSHACGEPRCLSAIRCVGNSPLPCGGALALSGDRDGQPIRCAGNSPLPCGGALALSGDRDGQPIRCVGNSALPCGGALALSGDRDGQPIRC